MEESKKESVIQLRSRSELEVDGVVDIRSFDETQAEIETSLGRLCVEGEGLRVDELSTGSGILGMKGKINGLYYLTDSEKKKKRFGRKD